MRNSIRLALLLIAASGLLAPLAVTAGGSAGRDFGRCTNGCTAARQNCDRFCQDDCKAMFPNNSAGRLSCQTECKDVCRDQETDCKTHCKAVKNDECPIEP
jgi:hypothetical protein